MASESQSISDSGTAIIQQIVNAISSNPNIWIPVLVAWACGFIFTRYLNGRNVEHRPDREFKVYLVNFIVSSFLYVVFNLSEGLDKCLPQAALSGAVAVLLPAVWFWWQKSKKTGST